MPLGWALVVLGVVCAIFFSWIVGLALFVIGAVILVMPALNTRRR